MATNKKSFDFRMSKKVAELTQVVHMLFTRNHEKEIEIEALKDAYEDEISCVIKDATWKILELEKHIEELKSQLSTNTDGLKEVELMREHLKTKEVEWNDKFTTLELQLRSEKLESQNSRDLLIHAQKDMETLRDGQNECMEMKRANDKIRSENEQLKSQIKVLQQKQCDFQSDEEFKDLLAKFDIAVKDVTSLKASLVESEKTREQSMSKNKAFEEQIKELKKEIQRRNERNSATAKQPESFTKASMINYSDEIVKLQNEIKRYRMELSNREGNFNRMFTDKNPVIIDRNSRKIGDVRLSSSEASQMRYTNKHNRERPTASLEENLAMQVNLNVSAVRPPSQPAVHQSVDISQIDVQDVTESLNTRYRSSSAHSTCRDSFNRLPQLGLETRRKLSKPKPLPKALISAKTTVH